MNPLEQLESEVNTLKGTGWRLGQTWFYIVVYRYPEIADQLRYTEYDPFNNDERIQAFIERVKVLIEETYPL
jgi:hypothetical protein